MLGRQSISDIDPGRHRSPPRRTCVSTQPEPRCSEIYYSNGTGSEPLRGSSPFGKRRSLSPGSLARRQTANAEIIRRMTSAQEDKLATHSALIASPRPHEPVSPRHSLRNAIAPKNTWETQPAYQPRASLVSSPVKHESRESRLFYPGDLGSLASKPEFPMSPYASRNEALSVASTDAPESFDPETSPHSARQSWGLPSSPSAYCSQDISRTSMKPQALEHSLHMSPSTSLPCLGPRPSVQGGSMTLLSSGAPSIDMLQRVARESSPQRSPDFWGRPSMQRAPDREDESPFISSIPPMLDGHHGQHASRRFSVPASVGFGDVGSRTQWGKDLDENKKQLLKTVLMVMMHQADADQVMENAKQVPISSTLEFFDMFDTKNKGFITDKDLWQTMREMGSNVASESVETLIREVHLRDELRNERPLSNRLSLLEFCTLIMPLTSQAYEAVSTARSDHEARSVLAYFRRPQPCPDCDVRVRRATVDQNGPKVSCGQCCKQFPVYFHGGDTVAEPLSVGAKHELRRLLETATTASEDTETERRQLTMLPGYDTTTLRDIFIHIAGDGNYMKKPDLKIAFAENKISIHDQALSNLWRRYAPRGAARASLQDFVRQLKLSM